jgi:hypothetical protein
MAGWLTGHDPSILLINFEMNWHLLLSVKRLFSSDLHVKEGKPVASAE